MSHPSPPAATVEEVEVVALVALASVVLADIDLEQVLSTAEVM